MRKAAFLAALLLAVAGSPAAAQEVVVLKGGTRIELKKPWVKQGNLALLTRSDGTLLSVPVSEIDAAATRAARAAARAPAKAAPPVASSQSPVEAAKAAQEGPKAKVRITDSDVGHEYVGEPAAEGGKAASAEKAAAGPVPAPGEASLQVAGFTQERSGDKLVVRGTLQNSGAGRAVSTRLTVTALDADGKELGSADASLSKGALAGGESVDFVSSIPVGLEGPPAVSVRFTPQWVGGPVAPAFPNAPSASPRQ
jgi:hypothetical protein